MSWRFRENAMFCDSRQQVVLGLLVVSWVRAKRTTARAGVRVGWMKNDRLIDR